MEMIIGRLGEQAVAIVDKTVSRRHCILRVAENGSIQIENLSPNGTYVNDIRIELSDVVKSDRVRLGPNFETTVGDLLVKRCEPEEQEKEPGKHELIVESQPPFIIDLEAAKSYTNYRMVMKDFKRYADLKKCLEDVEKNADSLPRYVALSVKSAIACKCLQSGKLSEAQALLYSAGDEAYDILDKSPELESCYATMMTLLAELYLRVFRNEEAENAARAATGILNRWNPGDLYIYPSIVGDAYSVLGDALATNGKIQMADSCYYKAIELYRQSGLEEPALYNAKISEIEKKVQSKTASKASIAPWIKRCCTCVYWCGHAEPNANISLVYYNPTERAKCTKTFRGSSAGQPADQTCANWEQRFQLKNVIDDDSILHDAQENKQRSINQDYTTYCPKCGSNSFTFRMNANTSSGKSYGRCGKCHYQAEVHYQNDSFATRVIKIG